MEDFSSWVVQNGGDDVFLEILKNFGFTSKLSLGNFDCESEDSKDLMQSMNCGQKCLLRGLVRAACSSKDDTDNAYKAATSKASEAVAKSRNLRATLGKLFNRKVESDDLNDAGSSSDFQPSPQLRKRSSKGKYPMKGPVKRKVKEYSLKVVGFKYLPTSTPAGALKESMTKTIWAREGSNAEVMEDKIKEAFGWSKSYKLKFMYSSGRHLRPANLRDVENSDSWDLPTIKALMGSGRLYVTRYVPSPGSDDGVSDLDESDESDDHENKGVTDLEKLRDIFPTLQEEDLQKALSLYCVDEAIERLLQNSSSSSSSTKPSLSLDTEDNSPIVIEDEIEPLTLQALLQDHSAKVMNKTSEYRLSVNRSTPDTLWQSVMSFYKSSKVKSYKLKQELVIDFSETGEVGADSGALRREFFEDAILQANLRLLEGDDERRVLKKDWGMDLEYEGFGMLVAHSVLQEGPGIPCLSPCMFQFLAGEDAYPVKEDIPLNAATHQLITFIEEMNNASSDDEIDSLFDIPSYSYILNNCGWKITEPITSQNKLHFLQHLIYNEVITQREANLKSFYRGLNSLKVGDITKAFPILTKPLFIMASRPITASVFISLISSKKPDGSSLQAKVYDYFMQFIDYLDGKDASQRVSLNSLLRSMTGVSTVPPMGLPHSIDIVYRPDSSTEMFPKAHACFCQILLPVIHKNREDFFSAFIKALEFGSGYGNV